MLLALTSLLGSIARANRLALLRERDVDPAVLAALVLDLAHVERADLAGRADVGAAAGLQVEALDLHQAQASAGGRRADRHGAHQPRPQLELPGIDPEVADRPVEGDPLSEPRGD